MTIGRGGETLLEKGSPRPSQTLPTPSQDFQLVGRLRGGSSCRAMGWDKKRLCYSMWLFHLHSEVKIQPFSPAFPLAGATDKAFCRLSLWSFKEKAVS